MQKILWLPFVLCTLSACSDESTVSVNNQAPDGNIDAPATNQTINIGDSLSFTGTGSDPDGNLPLTYHWSFGAVSGIADATIEDPGSKMFNTVGVFTVSFTVTDSLGLADPIPATRTITVNTQTPADPDPLSVPQGNVVRISPDGVSYADPEILNNDGNKITFQASPGRIWVADLNPVTGEFVSGTGDDPLVDTLVDTGATPLTITNNGPEFGRDAHGWSVFYSKDDGYGSDIQIWKAEGSDTGVATPQAVTSGTSHMATVTQKSDTLETTRILYIDGDWDAGMIAWLDEDNPFDTDFAPVVSKDKTHPTWVEDTDWIILRSNEVDSLGQLALYNVKTTAIDIITDDAGDKTFPFTWRAPEFNNELLALALVYKTSVAIYRDNGGTYWERIATLTIPSGSGGISVGSAEPVVAMGQSYISLSVQLNSSSLPGTADSQIWILGIDADPATRYTYRCDDGADAPVMRIDPETLSGTEQVFVYYNVFTTDYHFDIYRCATGIRTK